ncbi:MAG: rRNA maturation RNase YbeY [Phycisphaerales bacterium JB037]
MHDADPENPEPPPRRASASPATPCAPAADAPLVELTDATGRLAAADLAWLTDRARSALVHLRAAGELRARIIDDAAMRRAHADWLGDDSTTDVITFDLTEGHAALTRELDTDLLVCLDEATRQAHHRGHDARRELLLYLVHGSLHCLGHDDHEPTQAERMHALEDRTLDAIGVGAVYAPANPPEPGHREDPR